MHNQRESRSAAEMELGGSRGDDPPAIVLFPTPPFPLATTTTLRTPGMCAFLGGPPPMRGIVGGAGLLVGRPWTNDRVGRGRTPGMSSRAHPGWTARDGHHSRLTSGFEWDRQGEQEERHLRDVLLVRDMCAGLSAVVIVS